MSLEPFVARTDISPFNALWSFEELTDQVEFLSAKCLLKFSMDSNMFSASLHRPQLKTIVLCNK